jgi:hypothetical protein
MWWVLVLEAGVALFLLILIVWWTMFSGREPERPAKPEPAPPKSEADDSSNPG